MTEMFTNTYSSYAEVIIPLALPKNYTWAVPQQFENNVKPGIRVEVVLGKNRRYSGIVKKLSTLPPDSFKPKEILNVLDDVPVVNETQLQFWEWIAEYYMCSEGEVMQAAVPANLKLSGETILILNDEFDGDYTNLSDKEYVIAEALEIKKELKLSEVQQILDVRQVYPVIKKLIEKNVCYVWESLQEKYKEKKETFVLLHTQYNDEEQLADLLNNWGRAPKQMELLLSYLHLIKTEGEVTQTALLKKSNATPAQLKGLIEKDILIAEKRSVNRIKDLPKQVTIDFALSEQQQLAADGILDVFNEKQVCLLHGVTASGKTQIYVKLIEQYLKEDKQVLYMLPEIALTAQVIRRLQKHFGGLIAIYHSKFNPNERVEIWNKIKTGETKIVLGARSSLFLPFKDMGLIVVDEEHDASYKQQDPAPRYHARDAAIYYANLFNAKVLLGSATPSLESYFNASQNKYGLIKLTERFGASAFPKIEVVDTKMFVAKQKQSITPPLQEAIATTIEDNKQVILFQNRRGYTPYFICSVCGWIPKCNHCNVTLTYHKIKNKLVCHYCSTSYPVLQTCAACGSHSFIQKNFGTEKIEETLVESFTAAKIARMDYDSVKGKHDHDALIKLFEQQRIDVLVGTQMVVKGLDFANVQLVGIIDADSLLNFADFRVNERAYQLMEQVSGRAGRTDDAGKVLIQLSNTNHPVIEFVKQHSYDKMYDFEQQNRKEFFYPPYSRLIQITLKHKEQHVAEEAAFIMAKGLKPEFEKYISGPSEPVVNKIRNQYLYEVLLKLPKDTTTIENAKHTIKQQIIAIQSNKRYRAVQIIPDVDPV